MNLAGKHILSTKQFDASVLDHLFELANFLEPIARGPYTGSLGYLGFNRESQFNILIRTALVARGQVHYHAGAGIVADSHPEAEYEETIVKARAFFQALPAAIGSAQATPTANSSRL